MPYAQVLATASKASLAGGTFADTLTANTGDSLAVANYVNGGARLLEAWAVDSASVAELSLVYTRPDATHDQQRGLRCSLPAVAPFAAGKVAAVDIITGALMADVFKSDTLTIAVSGTAADAVVCSFLLEYDDLPGAAAIFASPSQVNALQKSIVGIRVSAVASGTAGAYGASRAFNADDDRLHGNTWYAIMGASSQIPVTSCTLIGPEWGGQRIGIPLGGSHLNPTSWFLDQSIKWGKSLIPVFNSANKANVLVQVADSIVSTSGQIDFVLYELNGPPF